MRIELLFIFFMLFVSTNIAKAETLSCKATLTKRKSTTQGQAERQGFKSFQTSSGREIIYRSIPSRQANGRTLVMLHGLGHDMTKLNGLINLAINDGLGVLVMDLQGHGKTLQNTYNKAMSLKPEDYHYESNVNDVYDLILNQKIKNFSLIGHSYGGGISFALAEKLLLNKKSHGLKLESVFLLAPYVQRIDKYIGEAAFRGDFWLQDFINNLAAVSTSSKQIENIFDPIIDFLWNLNRLPQFYQDYYQNFLGGQKVADLVQDPAMDNVLRQQLRNFFLEMLAAQKDGELTKGELQSIEKNCDACVLITKGIRRLDFLDTFQPLPQVDVPITIIAAKNDQLVLTSQLMSFYLRLRDEKRKVKMTLLDGKDVGHFFPQTNPEHVYQIITERIKSIESWQ